MSARLIAEYDGRFTSGNAIPVDRIWLTAAMWRELREALDEPAQSDRIYAMPFFFAAPFSWWATAMVGALAMVVGINLGLAFA